jgi:hypothetical protein
MQVRGWLGRAIKRAREDGLVSVARRFVPFVYAQLWPFLPEAGQLTRNGVRVAERERVTDPLLPASVTQNIPRDNPQHEALYVGCIRDHVTAGEDVVVGGGWGVSAVAVANQVAESGSVTVYEASREECQKSTATVTANGVEDIVTVNHGVVDTGVAVRGSLGGAEQVSVGDLPRCTTLCIDADGAERGILREMENRPDRLIAEHHAVVKDGRVIVEYASDEIRKLIVDCGYEIVEERYHESRAYGYFEERIFVANYVGESETDEV